MATAKMSFSVGSQAATEKPTTATDIDWEMLDKSRFFVLGAALFSGVSTALYPAVVLKTRIQVASGPPATLRSAAATVLRMEGPRGLYRGLPTSLAGTVPARALYMAALETTRSAVNTFARRVGFTDPTAAAFSAAAAGVSSAAAAQLVWTPVDVVSQRLMVAKYQNGLEAFSKIVRMEGVKGLYRGFGLSIFTYAPSNAVWWATYSTAQRCWSKWGASGRPTGVVGQGVSAAVAAGAAAVVTMPLDTVKTRLQVGGCGDGVAGAVRGLVKEGGWAACYRGLGPRWASMSLSAATMATTYEYLKKISVK